MTTPSQYPPTPAQTTPSTGPTGPTKEEAPKPCPEPPKRPAPEPEADGGPPPLPPSCQVSSALTPKAQLDDLKRQLQDNEVKVEAAEKLKTLITDLTQRIASLQKLVDGQSAEVKGYADFYNATEVTKSKIECAIVTLEAQLTLTAEQKTCSDAVITQVTQRVTDAGTALRARQGEVEALTTQYTKATQDLRDAKALHEFLKSGMVDEVKKKLADLAKLGQGADPPKDQCLAHFYLQEMKALLSSSYSEEEDPSSECYPPSSLDIGTFLDCWTPDCYQATYAAAVVAFNNAEYLEKCIKVELEAAKKKLADAEKTAKEGWDKRREWTVAALVAKDCCKKPVGTV